MSAGKASFLSANKTKIIFTIIIVAGLLTAVLLWPKPEEPGPEGITLKIITRHDTAIWEAFEPKFLETDYAKEHNIVDIQWVAPDPGLWKQVIEAGGVDVAWGGGPTLFDTMIGYGLLEPLTGSNVLARVSQIGDTLAGAPMKRFDGEGNILWVAAAISSFGFTVNHPFLETYDLPVPTRWSDLANRTYASLLPKATISMGNAPHTTSNTRSYEIILQAFGWDEGWSVLTRMAGNAEIFSGSGISVDVQSAVETGEVGIAMSIDFYGYTSVLRNPECEYIIPSGESIINGDPIALVNGTSHKEEAEELIAWILSPEGQSIWLLENINRMPVVEEAFETELGGTRPDLYNLYQITISNIGIEFSDPLALSYENSLMLYFQSVLTDVHEELVDAWATLVDAVNTGKITEARFQELSYQLGLPVSWEEGGEAFQFTMEYAQSINDQVKTDPTFANQMASIWRDAARTQYATIRDEVAD